MFRKTLLIVLTLLIADGAVFARLRAVQQPDVALASVRLAAATQASGAIRFRVSRPVTLRNSEPCATRARLAARDVAAG